MSELLPSELARLILGYIELKGYKQTAEMMLHELPELAEVNQRRKKGQKVNLRVGDLRLTDMLDDYYAAKDLILEYIENSPATFSSLKKLQPLVDHMKIILEMALKSKTYKFFPRNHYRTHNGCYPSKGVTSPINLPNNITVTIGEYSEAEDLSKKSYNIDATPESSLPGSSKRLNSPQHNPSDERILSTPDQTPQKRKGSLRKKNQPSPKTLPKTTFAAEDDKMEKLIKNLIGNTALHQKIAESINQSLYASNSVPGEDTNSSLMLSNVLQPKHVESSGYDDVDFSVTTSRPADPVIEGDASSGSKASLPDNVISNLSLQVTNDPMMDSILATLDCETRASSPSNRPLTTPVPSHSPSHSSHISFSTSEFTALQSSAPASLGKRNSMKEMVQSSFPVSFSNGNSNHCPDTSFFGNLNSSGVESLYSHVHKSSELSAAPPSLQNNQFNLNSLGNEETSREVGKVTKQTPFADTDQSNSTSEIEKLIFFKSSEPPQNHPDCSENAGLAAMKKLLNEAIDVSASQKPSLATKSDTELSRKVVQEEISNKKLDEKETSTVDSNGNTPYLEARSNSNKNFLTREEAKDKEVSMATQPLWPRTSQTNAFLVSDKDQNLSPGHPPSVQAIPVTSSHDTFVNNHYFSGTPDHPENYTFTELTPIPPVALTQETDHFSDNHNSYITADAVPSKTPDVVLTYEFMPSDSQAQSTSSLNIPSANISDMPLVVQSEQETVSPSKIVTEEYLGSRILKLPGHTEETSVVVVQMPYQDPSLPRLLPKPMKSLEEQRSEEKKSNLTRQTLKKKTKKRETRTLKKRTRNSNINKELPLKESGSSVRIKELLVEAFENSSKKSLTAKDCKPEEKSINKTPDSRGRRKIQTGNSRIKSKMKINKRKNFKSFGKAKENSTTNLSQSESIKKTPEGEAKIIEIIERTSTEFNEPLYKKNETGELQSCILTPQETSSALLNQYAGSVCNDSPNHLPKTDPGTLVLTQNTNMENLVDELENGNIEDIVKNIGSPDRKTISRGTEISNFSKKFTSNSGAKFVSPRLRSLISFSKSFILKSNLKRSAKSPSTNAKLPTYKGSHSTPRNKRNHIRVLDFSTPRKGLSPRRTPRARTNLKFSPPWSVKQRSCLKNKAVSKRNLKESPQKQSSLTIIPEDPKEGTSWAFDNSSIQNTFLDKTEENNPPCIQDSPLCQKQNTDELDDTLIMEVEEDLFLSEDESHLVIPSPNETRTNPDAIIAPKQGKDAPPLETPGKASYSFVCLESATPTPFAKGPSTARNTSMASELNTPILSAMLTTHDVTPFLKSYPQGPYSDSSEGIYYQPSERSIPESLGYSPLNDDIESVLIKTAQINEEEMAKSVAQDSLALTELHKEEENVEPSDSKNAQEIETSNNHVFDDLLKNRPKYRLRKLTNKELGEIVEQEMELFKKMQNMVAKTDNSNTVEAGSKNVNFEDSLSMTQDESSNNNNNSVSKWHKVTTQPSKNFTNNSQSLITFECFRCELEVLKTFTIAILRDSHIESARNMLESLLSIFEKAKQQKSTFSEAESIDLLLGIANFYASPEMAKKLKKRARTFNCENASSSFIHATPSSASKLKGIDEPITTTKTRVKRSRKIEEEVKPSKNIPQTNKVKSRTKTKSKKKLPVCIDLVECEIEAIISKDQKDDYSEKVNRTAISVSPLKMDSHAQTQEEQLTVSSVSMKEEFSNKTDNVDNLNEHNLSHLKSGKELSTFNVSLIANTLSKHSNNQFFDENEKSELPCKTRDVMPNNAACQKPHDCSDVAHNRVDSEKFSFSEAETSVSEHLRSPFCSDEIKDFSKGDIGAGEFKSNHISPKPSSPVDEFGRAINSTPGKEKKDCRRQRHRREFSKESVSHENSTHSSLEVLSNKISPQYLASPLEEIHSTNDEYFCIEKKLAALDGSVVNSPVLREQLLNNTPDEENISAILTPSSRPQDENTFYLFSENLPSELLSNVARTKSLHKSLISFTPLPGTPQKDVEEICQTVVKDKLALVAFPSVTRVVSSEDLDNELCKKVKDVSMKYISNKDYRDTCKLTLNEDQHEKPGDLPSPHKEAEIQESSSIDDAASEQESSVHCDDDADVFCTLSFSDLFDLLSLNIGMTSRNITAKRPLLQENADRAKHRRITSNIENTVDNKLSKTSRPDSEFLGSKQSTWQMNLKTSSKTNVSEPENLVQFSTEKENRKWTSYKGDSNAKDFRESPRHLNDDDDGSECLGELQLSSSESEGSEDSSSNSSTTERLSSGAKGVAKGLIQGGSFEVSRSPQKLQTTVSGFPNQNPFSYFNEESVYSIPPTPGKDLLLSTKGKPSQHDNENFEPQLSFPPNRGIIDTEVDKDNPCTDVHSDSTDLSKLKLNVRSLTECKNNNKDLISMKDIAKTDSSSTSQRTSPLKEHHITDREKNSFADSPKVFETGPTDLVRRSLRSRKPKSQKNEDQFQISSSKKGKRVASSPYESNLTSASSTRKRKVTSSSPSQNKKALLTSPRKKERKTLESQPPKTENKRTSPLKKEKSSSKLPKKESKIGSQTKRAQTPKKQIINSSLLFGSGNKSTNLNEMSKSSPSALPLRKSPRKKNNFDKELEKNVKVLTNIERQKIQEILDFIHPKQK